MCEFECVRISAVQRKSGLAGRTAALTLPGQMQLWAVIKVNGSLSRDAAVAPAAVVSPQETTRFFAARARSGVDVTTAKSSVLQRGVRTGHSCGPQRRCDGQGSSCGTFQTFAASAPKYSTLNRSKSGGLLNVARKQIRNLRTNSPTYRSSEN